MNEQVTTAVAIRDETSAVMLTNQQLTMIANTSFVPAAFRGKVPEVLACVATGRALGLPDMTSLRGINVIDGKASISAELMDAIVRSHGHSITGKVTLTEAVVRGKRADNGDEMEAVFSMAMAEKAGLTKKQNWIKHPDDMMWARAVSKLCRRLFADCFAGATHTPEELEGILHEPPADETLDELPEPDLATSGGDQVAPDGPQTAGAPPPTAGPQPSGSGSPWRMLIQVAEDEGFTAPQVRATAKQHCEEGTLPSSLDADTCSKILDELRAERDAL